MSYQLTFVGYIWLYTPCLAPSRAGLQRLQRLSTDQAAEWTMGSWLQSVFFAPVAEKLDPTDTYGMKKCICCMRLCDVMVQYGMVWYVSIYIYDIPEMHDSSPTVPWAYRHSPLF